MILKTFFTIDASSFLEYSVDLNFQDDIIICFRVYSLEDIELLTKKIFLSDIKLYFIVELAESVDKNCESFVSVINILFSHYKYLKYSLDEPYLYSFFSNETDASNNYIIKESQLLGFSKIHFLKPQYLISYNENNDNRDFDNAYYNALGSNKLDVFLFIKIPSIDLIFSCIDKMLFLESKFKNENPDFFELRHSILDIQKDNERLKRSNEILLSRVSSMQGYLHQSLNSAVSRNQVVEIVSFYNNEYEILPTWYKRFGHIIKVLMGKRTFRSLFNDNVKKYKD